MQIVECCSPTQFQRVGVRATIRDIQPSHLKYEKTRLFAGALVGFDQFPIVTAENDLHNPA
jgi:hypothetical protein